MLLSDAIRLGAMIRPQAFGKMQIDGGSCALGAAFEAVSAPGAGCLHLTKYFGKATHIRYLRCPDCGLRRCFAVPGMSLGMTITHLNDDHRWTREEIADWVATIEARETPTPHTATSDVRGTAVGG